MVGVADADFGQRLRAFVVLAGRGAVRRRSARTCASVARFKLPRDVVFMEELPRNATGKVLKRVL